ncbi:MAG: guanylate kinase [Thermodesulfovibrionales bacterium]
MRKGRGSLFIVSAPSGAGKTTLCQKLAGLLPGIGQSISFTTRPPRKGEVNDRDYTFISEDEFRKLITQGEFLEWAKVHGNLYGTSRRRLEQLRNEGNDAILDIDIEGARQVRAADGNGVFIFILPPSLSVLKARLDGRRSDAPEEIALRMKRAKEEIKEYKHYDYVIVNDVFDDALSELKAIVIAERLRVDRVNPEWVRDIMQ